MKNKIKEKLLITTLVALSLSACGGGSSSSGAPNITIPDSIGNIPAPRIGSEFIASQCIRGVVGIGGTRITNSCDQDVNVREISGGVFGPVFLIRANSTQTVDGVQVPLSACFAPRIPGGVSELLSYQCLL